MFNGRTGHLLLPMFRRHQHTFIRINGLLNRQRATKINARRRTITATPMLHRPISLPLLTLRRRRVTRAVRPVIVRIHHPKERQHHQHSVRERSQCSHRHAQTQGTDPNALLINPGRRRARRVEISLRLTIRPSRNAYPINNTSKRSTCRTGERSLVRVTSHDYNIPAAIGNAPAVRRVSANRLFRDTRGLTRTLSIVQPRQINHPTTIPYQVQAALNRRQSLKITRIPRQVHRHPRHRNFPLVVPVIIRHLRPTSGVVQRRNVQQTLGGTPHRNVQNRGAISRHLGKVANRVLIRRIKGRILSRFTHHKLIHRSRVRVPRRLLRTNNIVTRQVRSIVPAKNMHIRHNNKRS